MMASIEGCILEMRKTNDGETPGIEIRVFIPEPHRPGIVDQVFYSTEQEFETALEQNQKDNKKYSADLENMYSLCLEDIAIHPHRELTEVS